MFSLFLLMYRNTRESLGELEKAVEALAYDLCSRNISHPPKPSVEELSADSCPEEI